MKRINIDLDNLLQMYKSGMLLCEIGKHFGVSWLTVRNRLIEIGHPLRSLSETRQITVSHMTQEERSRYARAAHDAVRGIRRTMEDLCKRAKGKELRQSHVTRIELICVRMLEDFGFSCITQKAIGPYNVDIAITKPPIAVEIFGGHWHSTGRHAARFRKRFDYIINAGWLPVIIWVSRDYPLEIGAIKYIVSLAKKMRRGESVRSKEHMIWGHGKPTLIGEHKFNNRPGKPGPTSRDNATGRFTSRIS
jgi:very-short-patch-repair endonuclease